MAFPFFAKPCPETLRDPYKVQLHLPAKRHPSGINVPKPRSRIRRRRPKKSIKNAPTRQPTQKKQQHSQRRHTPFAPQTNKPPKSQKHAMQTQPTSPSSYKNQRSLQKESHGCHRPHLYSLLRQKNHPVRRWRQTKKWNQLLPLLCNAANSIIWTPIHHKNASSQKR